MLLLLLFCFGKKNAFKTSGRKTKVSPRSSKRVDTSQKDAQKITHPDDDDDDAGGGGCFDATRKKRTDRRNRRHDFPELKFVQDGGFTGGIETNLRAFFRALREESLRSVPTHTTSREKKFRATDARIHSTRSKSHARPRDEARRPMFHRIGSPRIRKQSPPLFFSSGRCPLRPPLLQARNSKSNPLPLHHRQIIKNAVRFDDEY